METTQPIPSFLQSHHPQICVTFLSAQRDNCPPRGKTRKTLDGGECSQELEASIQKYFFLSSTFKRKRQFICTKFHSEVYIYVKPIWYQRLIRCSWIWNIQFLWTHAHHLTNLSVSTSISLPPARGMKTHYVICKVPSTHTQPSSFLPAFFPLLHPQLSSHYGIRPIGMKFISTFLFKMNNVLTRPQVTVYIQSASHCLLLWQGL